VPGTFCALRLDPGAGNPLLFELAREGVALFVQRTGLVSRLLKLAAGRNSAGETPTDAGEQHVQAEHAHGADDDTDQQQLPGGTVEVISEKAEIGVESVRAATIGQHPDKRDNGRGHEQEQPESNHHTSKEKGMG